MWQIGKLFLVASLMCMMIGCSSAEKTRAKRRLAVHFIDVGGGDCTLFHVGEHALLVDAGTPGQGPAVVEYLRGLGIEDLDLVIGSHPHRDHIGGLATVIAEMPVDKVLGARVGPDRIESEMDAEGQRIYRDFVRPIDRTGIPFVAARAGQTYHVGPLRIDILHPAEDTIDRHDLNKASIIARIQFDDVAFLMPGDAGDAGYGALAEVLRRCFSPEREDPLEDLKADVLKVSGHGYRWGTTEHFLASVRPEVAVIPVGRGKPLLIPTVHTLNLLRDAGIDTYRTGLHGTIVITTDGQGYNIEVEKKVDPEKVFRKARPEGRR